MLKMFKQIMCISLLGTMTMTGCGNNKKDTSSETESIDSTALNLVYKHPDMGKVDSKKDIVYKAANDKQLKMDIYYPLGKKDASEASTVLLIHGIAPIESMKDTEVYNSWGRLIAANGLTAVTFNWRPSSKQNDVYDMIKYLRENSKDLKINCDSIRIFAFSAGVKEGVMQAVTADTGFIDCIAAYYGQMDSKILSINPGIKLPPMFIAMAAHDSIINAGSNDSFIKEAKDSGLEITHVVHSEGVHGFDVFNDNKETRDIIDKTLEFLKKQ